MHILHLIPMLVTAILLGACGQKSGGSGAGGTTLHDTTKPTPTPVFTLQSPAFDNGQPIPVKYTCKGDNISPPLHWSGAPAGTKCYALIMSDPDAPRGTWVHWVAWNIPADSTGLPEGISRPDQRSAVFQDGLNSWPKHGYGGPCPPSGTHRYYFRLYALAKMLSGKTDLTMDDLLKAIDGDVLGTAELMGTFSK